MKYEMKKIKYLNLEILYNKEICHLQLKKRRFICLSTVQQVLFISRVSDQIIL